MPRPSLQRLFSEVEDRLTDIRVCKAAVRRLRLQQAPQSSIQAYLTVLDESRAVCHRTMRLALKEIVTGKAATR
jgi:hypothetical protein